MSYTVIWSEAARRKLKACLSSQGSPQRSAWLMHHLQARITKDISEYPRDGATRAGQRASAELVFGWLRVHCDMQLDGELAFVTDIIF